MAELLPFRGRLWVLFGTVVLAAVVNLILEFTTQSKEDLLLCVYYKQRRKARGDAESGGASSENTESTGSFSSAGLDQEGAAVAEELTKDNNTVGQNPIFIMYQGRRPSAMSTYSADSLDGVMPSLSSTADLPVLQANGQNPLFMMHQGRRPSAVSTCSADSLDGVLPSTSSTVDMPGILTNYGRRSSIESRGRSEYRRGSAGRLLDPSLDDQSVNANSSVNRYPPVTVTTMAYVDSGDLVRALSPIREFESEEEHTLTVADSRKLSIQRSDSYMEALNNTLASIEKDCSKC